MSDKKKKVLIATKSPYAKEAEQTAVKIMEAAGLKVNVLKSYKSENDLRNELKKGYDAVIVRSDKINPEEISAGKSNKDNSLKLIVRGGAGFNTIDTKTAEAEGVTVMNTPGQNSNAVAELVFGLAVSAKRNIPKGHIGLTNGEFLKKECAGRELKGKKLGIHGFGNIGQIVAKIAHGFGMEIYAFDPYVMPDVAEQLGVTLVDDLQKLYAEADIITLHIPATPETTNSINLKLLGLMKKDGLLINSARAEVVDKKELILHLKKNLDFKYAADVSHEGEAPDSEMIELSNAIFTPHIGANTSEANFNAATAAARQVVDFLTEGIVVNAVNSPIPSKMRDYAGLATDLGMIAYGLANDRSPERLKLTAFSGLSKYAKQLSGCVIKGVFEAEGEASTIKPGEALAKAKTSGIEIKSSTEETGEHGYVIEVKYKADEGKIRHVIRATLVDGVPKITTIDGIGVGFELTKEELIAIFQYEEGPGMNAFISETFANAGYNIRQSGVNQSSDKKNAVGIYSVEKNGKLDPEELKKVVDSIKKEQKRMINAVAIKI
ncbi:NAD(P)-dependent oxidoreductase [Nanoarchaeota archaeon]